MKRSIIFASALWLLASVGQAFGVQYDFTNITNNSALDASIGEDQLHVDVASLGGNYVKFYFYNSGPDASSITDIYFDDDIPLLTFSSFEYYAGDEVLFTVDATPGNLPGGNSYAFSSDYSYDSGSPVQPNGVNPGEALGLIFELNENITFQNLLAALDAETFTIGIHVQGFASGGSEGFINSPNDPSGGPTHPVPEPATMLLFGAGIAGLAGIARRKRN